MRWDVCTYDCLCEAVYIFCRYKLGVGYNDGDLLIPGYNDGVGVFCGFGDMLGYNDGGDGGVMLGDTGDMYFGSDGGDWGDDGTYVLGGDMDGVRGYWGTDGLGYNNDAIDGDGFTGVGDIDAEDVRYDGLWLAGVLEITDGVLTDGVYDMLGIRGDSGISDIIGRGCALGVNFIVGDLGAVDIFGIFDIDDAKPIGDVEDIIAGATPNVCGEN